MAANHVLIKKSEENWTAVECLLESRRGQQLAHAIITRAYYSIFQLLKCSMMECDRMTSDATTGSHKLTRLYICEIDPEIGRLYKTLQDLRIQADYKIVPVDRDEVKDALDYWGGKRREFSQNLKLHGSVAI